MGGTIEGRPKVFGGGRHLCKRSSALAVHTWAPVGKGTLRRPKYLARSAYLQEMSHSPTVRSLDEMDGLQLDETGWPLSHTSQLFVQDGKIVVTCICR